MKWVANLFITVFVTMICIFIIKKISNRYNIPVVQDISNGI